MSSNAPKTGIVALHRTDIIHHAMRHHIRTSTALFALVMLLNGCTSSPTASPDTSHPAASATPGSPTETPAPLAALVNGDPIPLSTYDAELQRYLDASGMDPATQDVDGLAVLDRLIERQLLIQAANHLNLSVSQEEIDQHIADLEENLGGAQALQTWFEALGFTRASFRETLAQEMLAGLMINELVAGVAESETQVHAAHILVADRALAEQLRAAISNGTAEFGDVAVNYSLDLSTRIGGGDLGWFARDTLTMPEVEDAAFALGQDEISEVVQSSLGFHIVLLIDRQNRPLDFETLVQRRRAALDRWFTDQKATAAIEILIEP